LSIRVCRFRRIGKGLVSFFAGTAVPIHVGERVDIGTRVEEESRDRDGVLGRPLAKPLVAIGRNIV
jgi:hypothetical protein